MEWFLIAVLAGAAIGIEQARAEPPAIEPHTEALDSSSSEAQKPASSWPACEGPVVYRNLTTTSVAATYWLPDGRRCVPGARPEAAP
ncbi:hypothetical protein [Ectothiorhodospira variabilis]|uniref:hypothetical protein n=1 Tax=Ectothiorhodospira variabilis TaxID=505694 RepID=UPI001EFB5BE9|nr:hypothetical protein [Ectothiorhodospira variabilis]MCG5495548.1 hypothetical protein [Ectothiorhodospira variabilis]MCG5505156.1 hypothetical protein [Ectothiorhodospira variabilis]MCG5508313.1 hypothetical protein [Ectothiorhodospira variabilis]